MTFSNWLTGQHQWSMFPSQTMHLYNCVMLEEDSAQLTSQDIVVSG